MLISHKLSINDGLFYLSPRTLSGLKRARRPNKATILASALLFVLSCCGGMQLRADQPRKKSRESRQSNRQTESSPATVDQEAYRNSKPLATQEGTATYYADSLDGNRTASGEVYDRRSFTAASRDLPFGTIVRVVRNDNKLSVIVRINDRGPFSGKDRIIDLSRAAADRLDMIRSGVIRVRVEVLEYGKSDRKR